MAELSKYGVSTVHEFFVQKRGSADLAVGADWSPAAGDVKISKDGGAAANVTNLPVAKAMGNTASWEITLTATEKQAARIAITIADAATKAIEDDGFIIETYGHASAQHKFDLDTASVAQTGDAYAVVNSGTHGNAALKTSVDAVDDLVDTEIAAIKAKTDALPADPADQSLIIDATNAIMARLGAPAGASVSADVAAVKSDTAAVKAKTDALPAAPAAVGDIPTAAAIAAAVWDTLTSALTTVGSIGKLLVDRIDAAVSSRLPAASYTAPDNPGIAAINAKTANLPPDPADASDIDAAFNTTVAALAAIDSSVGLVKAKTDGLPAQPAAVTDIPTAAANAAAVFATIVENGLTFLQWVRLEGAALFGRSSGMETATGKFRDTGNTKDRITATMDASGNRSAVTLDGA